MKLNELLTEAVHKNSMNTALVCADAWHRIMQGNGSKTDISTVAGHPKYAYDYAKDILHGRFPRGEPAILTSSWWSYQYAVKILKERWPEGEPIIFEDHDYGILYVYDLGIKYPVCKEYVNNILQNNEVINNDPVVYKQLCQAYFSNNTVLLNKWIRYAENVKELG